MGHRYSRYRYFNPYMGSGMGYGGYGYGGYPGAIASPRAAMMTSAMMPAMIPMGSMFY